MKIDRKGTHTHTHLPDGVEHPGGSVVHHPAKGFHVVSSLRKVALAQGGQVQHVSAMGKRRARTKKESTRAEISKKK